MRIRMLLLVMLASAVLTGCDDTTSPDKDEDFILSVMVLDAGGQPKAGMTVARRNDLEGFIGYEASSKGLDDLEQLADSIAYSYPNPFYESTVLRFSTDDVRKILLQVKDWRGNAVRTMAEARIPEGFFSYTWNQRDDGGDKVINGVYTFDLTLTDTLDVPEYEWSGLSDCTVFDPQETHRFEGIGFTNATGFFSTRDLDLFPSLQGHEPQTAYDEAPHELGTFSFSDTVTITVSTPPPAEGGFIYYMSRRIVLVDGPNYLEFHFVPDDSMGVFVEGR